VAALHAQQAAQGKPMLAPKAYYDAARQGRRMAGWNPPSAGPNAVLTGLQNLRNRSRDVARNDWSGKSASQKWATNLVGIGITPRFKRITDQIRKQEVNDLWHDFVKRADADSVLNFYGLQTLAVKAWLSGGECFIRKRARFVDEELPVPMQVQLLEAEMVPMWDSDAFEGLPTGNKIRSGIELDKRGRRIAYWVYKEHPGDGLNLSTPTADTVVRVAASQMRHLFEPERPGQLRGVSMLAPVLARLKNIENYDDATLTRQQLANLVVAFITRQMPAMTGDEDLNGLTGEPDMIGAEGKPLVGLQPGLVQTLEDGEDVTWSNPPEAGTNYSDYMRTQHMGTAAGAGLPYEIFSGDIKEVSDRTLRVIINDFRRFAEQRQWQHIIPMFCEPVMEWFAQAALLVGKISQDEFAGVTRAEWSPHGWAYIHPVQDPQGKKLEVEAGFRSRSSVIGQNGDDPDEVDAERAADIEREKKLGLWVDPMSAAPVSDDGSSTEVEDDGIDDNEYNAPPNPNPSAMDLAILARIEAETEALRARARQTPPPPPPPDPEAAKRTELLARTLKLLEPDGEQQ
jgi:lambda family phage portal protein